MSYFCCNLHWLQVYFGVSSLLDASSSDGQKAEEEQKEVDENASSPFSFSVERERGKIDLELTSVWSIQAELAVSELSGSGAGILSAANTVVSTFLLVFVAEWGDKSFFSTIGEVNTL